MVRDNMIISRKEAVQAVFFVIFFKKKYFWKEFVIVKTATVATSCSQCPL